MAAHAETINSGKIRNYSGTQTLEIVIGEEFYVVYEMLNDGASGYGNSKIHAISKVSELDAIKSIAHNLADGHKTAKVKFVRCVTDYDFDEIIHCSPYSPSPGLVLADAEYKGYYSDAKWGT